MSSAKTKKTAPGTGSCRGWWWEHDWAAVRVGSIVVGDQLANHSTVTKVAHGPASVKWGGSVYELAQGDSFVGCGNGNPHGFAYSQISTDSSLIVGRNGRLVRREYRWSEPPHGDFLPAPVPPGERGL